MVMVMVTNFVFDKVVAQFSSCAQFICNWSASRKYLHDTYPDLFFSLPCYNEGQNDKLSFGLAWIQFDTSGWASSLAHFCWNLTCTRALLQVLSKQPLFGWNTGPGATENCIDYLVQLQIHFQRYIYSCQPYSSFCSLNYISSSSCINS